jgi:uncharacterized membrane protein
MGKQKRLGFALAAYALLGVLIWTTMSDVPIKVAGGQISIRAIPLAIIAFFAVKTVLHWKADQIREEKEEDL